ncbi:hypothetical protein [Actinomadura atramentaria]|uniref:hypothetical protein n=1 Tax=Actinomadura atramentaria TaxID=1990 RepID=UPI00036B37AD|nr:hypothetical protein [Actinomadura atramentaria]
MRARPSPVHRRRLAVWCALLVAVLLALPGAPPVPELGPSGDPAVAVAPIAREDAEDARRRERPPVLELARRAVLPLGLLDDPAAARRLVAGLGTHPALALDHAALRGDRAPGARLLIALRVSRI